MDVYKIEVTPRSASYRVSHTQRAVGNEKHCCMSFFVSLQKLHRGAEVQPRCPVTPDLNLFSPL